MAFRCNTLLRVLGGASIAALATVSVQAEAQAEKARTHIDLPAQPLGDALKSIGLATRNNVVADSATIGDRFAPPLAGDFSVEEALARVLSGSGLAYRQVGSTFVIELARQGLARAGVADSDITVTGSRIRGAPATSLVISTTRETIQASGITSLADAVRSIPQNFGGGANPGIGYNVPTSSGADIGGTSTVNLRGLGSDATLTLINGHRAAYNGSRQGIDISAIPLGIVERMEVVPDGASAIYGSDAVAGVVNVILRRNFDGVEVRADVGGATEGAGARQQYGLVAGKQWSSGGVVVAYEYQDLEAMMSPDRKVSANRPGLTLFPDQRRHAAVLNGHQDIAPGVTFAVDALFNRRFNFAQNAQNARGDLVQSRAERRSTSRSLVIAPSLSFDFAQGWQANLAGVYGKERLWLDVEGYAGDTRTSSTFVCYCNELRSAEIGIDGPVVALPGGMARIAAGAGYRDNLYKAYQLNALNASGTQDVWFAYGEINLPILAPALGISGAERLDLTGAVRWERYPGIGSVATPKLGVLYSPVRDFTIKGSWGRSFRAPTMYQLYQGKIVEVYEASRVGGASGRVLYVTGGSTSLRPERAKTWSATLEFKPHRIPGLEMQLSYFSVDYKDRIVTPIAYTAQALTNALYADYVTPNPSPGAIAATSSSAALFYNFTAGAYSPSQVTAIVDNSNINAGRQTVRGVDALVQYDLGLGEWGELGLIANASYIESDRVLTPGAARTELAGTLFNPPHWRARTSVTWSRKAIQFNATLSHIGGVTDARSNPAVSVQGMTTADFTARYAFGENAGFMSGISLNLIAMNLFNAAPDRITTANYSEAPFDTTNYSAVGRYLGFGIVKSW